MFKIRGRKRELKYEEAQDSARIENVQGTAEVEGDDDVTMFINTCLVVSVRVACAAFARVNVWIPMYMDEKLRK